MSATVSPVVYGTVAAAEAPSVTTTRVRADVIPVQGASSAKLWELDAQLFCPVIGTCLPVQEVRTLARKHGLVRDGSAGFDAHVAVINACKSRTPLARDVQRMLDRRHALVIRRFAALASADAVAAAWADALAAGEAAGAMWAAVTCRHATPALRQRVYEDMHMLSHQVGAGVRADLARTATLAQELAEAKAELARQRSRMEAELGRCDVRAKGLEARLAAAEAGTREMQALRQRLHALESGDHVAALARDLASARTAAAELARKAERAGELERRMTDALAENARLSKAMQALQAERDALARAIATCPAAVDDDATSDVEADLSGRRLLYVGGRINLQVQYRTLVERARGNLLYHDGGKEEGLGRLTDLLGQADAVIFPIDCVSHAAYHKLRRHCRVSGKPCVMLHSAGIAGFADGLRRLADGHWTVPSQRRDDRAAAKPGSAAA